MRTIVLALLGFSLLLARSGAIPKVPPNPQQDKRLVRIGGLRLKALIRRDQF